MSGPSEVFHGIPTSPASSEIERSSSSEEEDDTRRMELMMLMTSRRFCQPEIHKMPCRTSILRGPMWVDELLNGHPARIWQNLHIAKEPFMRLCNALVAAGLWVDEPQQRVDVRESLAIFLHVVTRNNKHNDEAERFQHSSETVSRHAKKMSKCLYRLARYFIKPGDIAIPHPKIINNDKHFPWFMDCIGAIDGTHISAYASGSTLETYRNRKSNISQNVIAACDRDMKFVYVYAGWERSAHDSRVLFDAITKDAAKFPCPPEGKYYLVDAGFANQPGFLAPFKGERYHKSNFAGAHGFRSARELFNRRHSSIRNVIERTFGVLKKRYPILSEKMAPYSMGRQIAIIVACCVVYNFTCMNDIDDPYFYEFQREVENVRKKSGYPQNQETTRPLRGYTVEQQRQWSMFRDSLAASLWQKHTAGGVQSSF